MTTISSNVSVAAFVRATLKFDPQESIAIVLCHEGTVLATLRVDLRAGDVVTEWVEAIDGIISKITADQDVDATVLVAYDEDEELKGAKYDALAELLEMAGAPIQHAILVANDQIMDYDSDETDAVAYSVVESEAIILEALFHGKNPLRAKDIEHCEESSIEVQAIAVRQKANLLSMGTNLEEIARKVSHEMVTNIAIYREAGEMTDEVAGWLAGTFTVSIGRDLAVVALAGIATTTHDMADYLVGDRAVDDRKILEAGHEMLFDSLAHIAGIPRTNILCAIAWAHWTLGNGTEAMATLGEAIELEPEHRLANLLIKLIVRGKMAKTALINPQQ
ncbi:DUF4192 family protein [Glutamicibacter ardleyensis]|uniref:DUF4192 family protein n=1 Tax=Glutamicibacter ardleyensis TaxID=225894 RepID=UPI003FCF2F75